MDDYCYPKESDESIKLVKIKVCRDCLSPEITDINCRCVYSHNYPTIELEFEECKCCKNISNEPVDTEFNRKQLETL